MKINCSGLGKRYNRDWIFRNFTYSFTPDQSYAITGPNGSGKSTLLQVIAGAVASSEGSLTYLHETLGEVPAENHFKHLSLAAPYLELIEEMTSIEFLNFHAQFKPFLEGWDTAKILEFVQLKSAANRQIRFYSSGMRQRVKLAQAFFSNTSVVLLDEPCTNLDTAGFELYQSLVSTCGANRLLIVSSNDVNEYSFCKTVLGVGDWKK
jgi:ABC-type multidrug transport system ATPase subunit